MKLLLSCLVIFMTFSVVSFGEKSEKLDEKHSKEKEHLSNVSPTLNFITYYQVEDELLAQVVNQTNIANVFIEGNKNSVNVIQTGVDHFENTMIWGNENQVIIQQLGPINNYASVFIQGNQNIINIKQ